MRPFPVAAVLILAGMLAGCHGEAKMYSATAEIEVTIPDYMGDFGIRPNSFLPGQIKIMQYPEMLMPVITKLNLDQKWAARFGTGRAVMPAEEALQHLKKNLAIEVVKGANILKITAQSEAPQEAADIANGVADQYKIFRDRLAAEELKRGEDAIRDSITKQTALVDEVRAEIGKQVLRLGHETTPGTEQAKEEAELDSLKRAFAAAGEGAPASLEDAVRDLPKEQGMLSAMYTWQSELQKNGLSNEIMVKIVSRAVPPPA